ncbi:methylenetetrahydrofolate--tRNA-(uracil(54)-C(5))-methyltransferase (FADH(2)-oxidizing) TrmFO [Lawsonia intracellularis]|uniref:methylenetetrahydrofolate--tRNA-(uracil(54)- C(5))-methyltransferase (FADH(2)-oxidizing) TrmFO n=1 Tax=Lawsonia intracellularis TaxID=29546 RepID=UPI0009784E74|nr:methylenetetrahydrofolate--tRNA-(uracil(54)-C(5))-methyltransferase (FADH(2)-oxidizing) TrmFO [Lawsonia intracellularis]OMQ02988.1 methylenetetrahydrofolate--tRNA-(uracil(54)-C(5))-methyltransferase (FADH(2)-oxidizing) TrmFO [Lawsonia intracellularis]
MNIHNIAIIGGGLSGCECALTLAKFGFSVTLFEQKPQLFSPAHNTPLLAELVCSNSLRSNELTTGIGLLKQELRELNSPLMAIADTCRVPAGKALAVDRELFSKQVTQLIESHPKIHLIREEVSSLSTSFLEKYDRIIVATGPLASPNISNSLSTLIGDKYLYFYDAIAPIVTADSIDMSIAFWGSRYEEQGEGDYLNCPMSYEEYQIFYSSLLKGEKVTNSKVEKEIHFEGCMPIEALAERGEKTLLFGPFKPVGLINPHTGLRPYAVLQLRPENLNKSMLNLVGCQTKLTYPAQDTIFRLVPGLSNVEFVRFGSMHRNTYINSPKILTDQLALRNFPCIHLAGQITGVEGYVESIACGLWVSILLLALSKDKKILRPPKTCALGGLLEHISCPSKQFQPSNIHFGLVPEPTERIKKKERKEWYAQRARIDFHHWLNNELIHIM